MLTPASSFSSAPLPKAMLNDAVVDRITARADGKVVWPLIMPRMLGLPKAALSLPVVRLYSP